MATETGSGTGLALLTDLYQLTMAQGYFQSGTNAPATFSLFIRTFPLNRGYFVAAGLDDVLRFLENIAFEPDDLDYLRSLGLFSEEFLQFLGKLRFTGDVWAIPEGRLFFKDEPILEVSAPIIEAQVVETLILNQVGLQSLIATKAARCVHAAGGRPVADFALRRTHGIDAGMKVARASFVAGFAGTSNVLAGRRYGIPVVGTMAHSFVTSFAHELDAFRAYASSFPDSTILLIDTYDTLDGARNAVLIAAELQQQGHGLRAVRIDSGDLDSLARDVRRILDQSGFPEVKILGSGGLDEYDLHALTTGGAPYDSFGVGTKMGVSADAPWTDIAYKLVEYQGRDVLKLSPGKESWPGKKQIFRFEDGRGGMARDVVGLRDQPAQGGEPLLEQVMARGRRRSAPEPIAAPRQRFLEEIKRLDAEVQRITDPAAYPVLQSPSLSQLRRRVKAEIASRRSAG